MNSAVKTSRPTPAPSWQQPAPVQPQDSASAPPPRWGLLTLAVLAALLTAALIGTDLLAPETVPTASASPQATTPIR